MRPGGLIVAKPGSQNLVTEPEPHPVRSPSSFVCREAPHELSALTGHHGILCRNCDFDEAHV